MKIKLNRIRSSIVLFTAIIIFLFITSEILEARGGGGGRGSFGGSRSSGISRSSGSSASKSFGGSRSSSSSSSMSKSLSSGVSGKSSFGASRLNSHSDYTSKYGVPRERTLGSQTAGMPSNYVVNNYGGYSSGLMMGYVMGSSSWMWHMPFHPAFYYSQPYYVENPDGTVEVYPPTFSWGKLIFTLIVVGAIIYVVYVIIREKRKSRYGSYSSAGHASFD